MEAILTDLIEAVPTVPDAVAEVGVGEALAEVITTSKLERTTAGLWGGGRVEGGGRGGRGEGGGGRGGTGGRGTKSIVCTRKFVTMGYNNYYSPRFTFRTHNSSLEGAMEHKFASFCSP